MIADWGEERFVFFSRVPGDRQGFPHSGYMIVETIDSYMHLCAGRA